MLLQTCLPKIADFANKNGLFANISIFAQFPIANMAGGRSAFYKVLKGVCSPCFWALSDTFGCSPHDLRLGAPALHRQTLYPVCLW